MDAQPLTHRIGRNRPHHVYLRGPERDHRIRVEGGGIIGAAILMAIAGGALRRPDEVARFDLHDSASGATQLSERAVLIVRPDQTELYECAVRAFGAARVLYDRRQGER
jgi:hypothetical protein